MTTVAILGTGKMGGAMARRLAGSGFDLTLWDRTSSKAEELHVGRVVATPAEAARAAQPRIVIRIDELPTLPLDVAAAHFDLILDRGLPLQIGAVTGVDNDSWLDCFPRWTHDKFFPYLATTRVAKV